MNVSAMAYAADTIERLTAAKDAASGDDANLITFYRRGCIGTRVEGAPCGDCIDCKTANVIERPSEIEQRAEKLRVASPDSVVAKVVFEFILNGDEKKLQPRYARTKTSRQLFLGRPSETSKK